LRCLNPYRNRDEHIPAGTIIELDEARAVWLMRDAPGCFEFYQPNAEAKMLEEPPEDKMIKPRQTRKK